ncbi:adenylate/guanylate cyclase domain-containing protein [Hydrogenophaga sp. RWCD_12]|uniref:adenylate/guanylate cyclase domain-containing protein n=1 Tax=Hydrogenophaga sp. RWCD_12 TaxID=3391190 RepID=UPI003985641F
MTRQPTPITIGSSGEPAQPPVVPSLPLQHNKVVLVMDLVESVRLMASNEVSVVLQWHSFLQHARDDVLPSHGGRLVKSLGDGILAEFDDAVPAARAALKLHRYFDTENLRRDDDHKLWLRAGINATHLYVDQNDVFGHGVNLAARVAGLAGPGETVITADVHDALVDGVDADMQDMGESYLKHWPEPVRTWTLSPPSGTGFLFRPAAPTKPDDFRATIAVLPFVSRGNAAEHFVIGELLADGVIVQLSRSHQLRVISRLSTSVLRGREDANQTASQQLDANFVLSGSYVAHGDRVLVTAELCDTRHHEVVWADRITGNVTDVLQQESELINTLASTCADQLLHSEVQRTLTQALPRLDSSALMLGAINLMHRSTRRDLERSQQLLEALVDRHKRSVAPWAWLAKWHIMQVVQGMAPDPNASFQRAIDIADRALDMTPDSALALSVKGHAMCHLGKDIQGSHHLLLEATHSNPNDPMGWLYSSVWSTMWGSPEQSVIEAQSALQLSPLDPQKYYFEMMLGNCYLALGKMEDAVVMCEASLRKNRFHLPTIRALLVSQYELGRTDDAKATFDLLRAMQPELTVSRYLASAGISQARLRTAKAMEALGLPKS